MFSAPNSLQVDTGAWEVDSTCVQIGLGEENYTLKGEEFPHIYIGHSYVIYKSFLHGFVCLCLAAVLKQKYARMHQILFQFFPGYPGPPPLGALPPDPRGGKGRRAGRGKGGGREEEGEFASLPLGDRRPCVDNSAITITTIIIVNTCELFNWATFREITPGYTKSRESLAKKNLCIHSRYIFVAKPTLTTPKKSSDFTFL